MKTVLTTSNIPIVVKISSCCTCKISIQSQSSQEKNGSEIQCASFRNKQTKPEELFCGAVLSATHLRSYLRFGTDRLTFKTTAPRGLLGRCLLQGLSTSGVAFLQQDCRHHREKLYSRTLSDLAGMHQSNGDGDPGLFGALGPCGVGNRVHRSSDLTLIVAVLARRDRDTSASATSCGSKRNLSTSCHRRVRARAYDWRLFSPYHALNL